MPSPYKKSFAAEQLRQQQQQKKTGLWIFLAVAGLVVVVGGYALYSRFTAVETPAPGTVEKPSIAVLPFENISPEEEQEYFCDGLVEEIINALTHVKGLRVIARNSAFAFKGQHPDIREVGEKLDVEYVLEGSVRKSDNNIRISAQLIKVDDHSHLWSNIYERTLKDVFSVQEEISLSVVDELKVTLLGDEKAAIVERQTEDSEAYDLYLMGRSYWNRRNREGYEKALGFFQKAVEKDPDFALAYTGIADSYNNLERVKENQDLAKAAAEKALELDDKLAEAHSAIGLCYNRAGDSPAAERAYKQAIALNPGYVTAHEYYGVRLAFWGRLDESVTETRLARELDPLSTTIRGNLILFSVWAGRLDEAMEEYQKTLEMNPNWMMKYWYRGIIQFNNGKIEEAITLFLKSIEFEGERLRTAVWLGCAYAKTGERDKAENIISKIRERNTSPVFIAMIYVELGEIDRAFDCLENAGQDKFYKYSIKWMPGFEPLRSDPRYPALLKKIGLSE